MDRGTVERERPTETDPDPETERGLETEAGATTNGDGWLRSRLPSRPRPLARLGRAFSIRAFAVVLGLAAAAVVGGTFVPLPGSRFVLLFAATFGVGALDRSSRYAECASAGAFAGGLGVVSSVVFGGALLPVVAGYGAEVAGLGVAASTLVALAGHYFGRDLRAGWVDGR